MADDETTDATEPVDATEESTPEKKERASVAVPAWALVVAAVLAAGGIGYAIGNDSNDSNNLIDPIANIRSAPGDAQGDGNACPRPPGGHDGGQLQPGPGNGPGGIPGGPLGPGFGPGFGPGGDEDRDERNDRNQDQDDQDQDNEQDEDQESDSSI